MAVELTLETLDEFVNSSELPVIIDCWAPWCTPCKKLTPVIDEMQLDAERIANFAKVDVDKYPEVSTKYNFASIPALLLFNRGEFIGRIQPIGFLKQTINDCIRISLAEREQ